MSLQRTLSIIKPNAVKKNCIGAIIQKLEEAELRVVGMKMMNISREDAAKFYAIHKDRSFFQELIEFMTSGPVVIMALQGEDAVQKNRDVMGATDPKKAAPGTIRALYGEGIEANAVHGSDSVENGIKEIAFFFAERELLI
jgi:nucleoside-diphosphate kinase